MGFRGVFCVLLSGLFYLPLKAQDEVDTQLWINYALDVRLSPNLSYGGDIGYRRDVHVYDWDQFLIRPTLTYRLNRIFRVAGGLSLFQTFNRNTNDISEFRIHQDINVNILDFGWVNLFGRFRAEQRFFYFQDLPSSLSPSTFNIRLRFLGGAQTKDLRIIAKQPMYFQFLFEGFVTLNQDVATEFFINNTRAHFAFGHRVSDSWRYEVHYIRQGSRLLSTDGLRIGQNIFRLRLFHTIFEKKEDLPDPEEPDLH